MMALHQIISAVQLAWDPTSNQNLKRQAFDYVNQLRQEPSAWQPCLSIFTQIPKQAEVVRVFCLEIVNSAVQAGVVDQQGLRIVKEQLMEYLKRSYGSTEGATQPDAALIENKIAQTITYLFAAFYGNGWDSCFDDLLALTAKDQPATKNNAAGTTFYLRVVNSIHDEIGDILLSRSRAEQDRANSLKDMIRARDVQRIAASWQEILSQWRMSSDLIAELCLKAVGKWVSWIDISLIVNQQMLELLFQQLERAQATDPSDGQQKARDAAIDVFTETAGKKMPTADKVNLIEFLNLESIVAQLISCRPLNERRFGPTYDTDLAETVAKLVNTSVIEIVKILEAETTSPDVFQKAEGQLRAFLPHLLRFFSDEYDEVCSTVINAMNDVLAFLRKTTQGEAGNSQRAVMLLPILKAIFGKMRYDETSSWGDDDEQTDEAEFQDLRKRLGALQQAIAAADEQLYMDAISGLVNDTFNKLGDQSAQVNWRDLDLALYEMYLFGDLAVKYGGLYQKNKPNSLAAEKLVQMMLRMVQSSKCNDSDGFENLLIKV
jgi:exportin-T